jgi:hypothetical protein
VPPSIRRYLTTDHERLDALLARAIASPPGIDEAAFGEFRAGLLRHIAMEEKVLFTDARARGDAPLRSLVGVLHADHAAIASMLVPPPTPALIASLRAVLDEHNPLEEDPGGLYDRCDELSGGDPASTIARMEAIPPVRASQYLDEPRIHQHIERMLAARRRAT